MILNIHGYGGSAQNSAYTALLSLGCDVTSPQLDYDAVCPVCPHAHAGGRPG